MYLAKETNCRARSDRRVIRLITAPDGNRGKEEGVVDAAERERVPKARYIDITAMHGFLCALECEVGILGLRNPGSLQVLFDHTNFYPDLLPWFVIHLTE